MERIRSFGIRRGRPVRMGQGLAQIGGDEPRLRELLGLPVVGHDPVAIITAAQIRLRRWRRRLNADAAAHDRIRRITQARDALLRRVAMPENAGLCN